MKTKILASLILTAVGAFGAPPAPSLTLSREDYVDRVNAIWHGQLIAVSITLPFEHKIPAPHHGVGSPADAVAPPGRPLDDGPGYPKGITMSTATVKELRHEFPRVYAAARRGPVRITKQGKVIATFDATPAPIGKWTPPDFTARSRAILGTRKRAIDIVKLWDAQECR